MAPFWGDLGRSEKHSEIKPPLAYSNMCNYIHTTNTKKRTPKKCMPTWSEGPSIYDVGKFGKVLTPTPSVGIFYYYPSANLVNF